MFCPDRERLNMSVVKSASAKDSFFPFTYLFMAY